jgi:N,N'-diacetylchitobiose transport system permease protein
MLTPMIIVIGVGLLYPIGRLIVNSFQSYGLRAMFSGTNEWIGLDNYISVVTDPMFWPVVLRTLGYCAVLVIGGVGSGMILSEVMIRAHVWVRKALTVVLIMAWAVPTVASTLAWQWLFQPLYGVNNWLITQLGIFGDFTSHDWTMNSLQGLFIVWLLITWQGVPFIALTLYAAQSQIPREYYEAGELDGAGLWALYRHITLPFIQPFLSLVTILSIIWKFNIFNELFIFTRGGPNGGTTTLGIWTFVTAFAANDYGRGSAIAVITIMMLAVLSAFYIRQMMRSGEHL